MSQDEEMDKSSASVSSMTLPPPPDDGTFYCSLCNWIQSIYDRFDHSFVTYYIVQSINHGLSIIVIIALKDYYKQYLGLNPGD